VHLGAALGKPVVGVRGGGHIGRFWPWGDPKLSRVAATELDCYGCNWVCVHDRVRCVEDIPVETLRVGIEAAIACLPAAFEA
jgi:ADP-heptose:LPS heptosyltransferase